MMIDRKIEVGGPFDYGSWCGIEKIGRVGGRTTVSEQLSKGHDGCGNVATASMRCWLGWVTVTCNDTVKVESAQLSSRISDDPRRAVSCRAAAR